MFKNYVPDCSTIIAGKNASFNHRVLVAHNEDDGGHVTVRRTYVPPRDWPEGSTVPAEKGLASIPQVSRTLGFYWVEVLMDEVGMSTADSFYNDCGVLVVSNSQSITREDLNDPSVVKDGGVAFALRRCIAERAHTAREGARILTALMDEYGYAPAGRAYTIADKDEAFMFQTVRGHHYVGARVPDDAVVFMPNHYTFHTLHDVPEMFYPRDIVSYAEKKGWYVPAKEDRSDFDFARAYQDPKSYLFHENTRRQEHAFKTLLTEPWDFEKDGYPFCVTAEKEIGLEDIFTVLTEHFEGSEEGSHRSGPGRSPHNDPDAIRRICDVETVESDIWLFEDDPKRSCVLSCIGRPCQVPYIPLHPLLSIPECLLTDEAPEMMLRTHLLPHSGASCAKDGVPHRFRALCDAQELLYSDVNHYMRPLLKEFYRKAAYENAAVQQNPGAAPAADAAFITDALKAAERIAGRYFKTAVIDPLDPFELSEDTCLSVRFRVNAPPLEETLCFGVEGTIPDSEFGKAAAGSLRALGGGLYEAVFEMKPLTKVLAYSGEQYLWLGGRTESGRAFAACIRAEIRRKYVLAGGEKA